MAAEPQATTNKTGILLPAPTAWPLALALGNALVFFGMLTDVSVSVLGSILVLFGVVGWFREVLPHEHDELVAVEAGEPAPVTPPRTVERVRAAEDVKRAWLPLKTYPVLAGVKGGLAGGVAMAILAMLYGAVAYHSIWYPVNLLVGSLYAPSAMPTLDALKSFNWLWLVYALGMHVFMCLLVGLLYGAMLPLLPGAPILLGGVIGPILWTGLLYQIIGYVNPLMERQINWWWFALSQAAFGVVAGLVVTRHNKEWTKENMPLAMRAGIEAPGLMEERGSDEDETR
jgi:hypothetical protein